MFTWIWDHNLYFFAMGIFSCLSFVFTLIAVPLLLIRIPENYFVKEEKPSPQSWKIPFVLGVFFLVLKNLLAVVFILTGIIMLFTPGQGTAMIFIGVLISNFPGKRRLERKIISNKKIFKAINFIREKAKHPPLKKPKIKKIDLKKILDSAKIKN